MAPWGCLRVTCVGLALRCVDSVAPKNWKWTDVRAELDVKGRYFDALARRRGVADEPGCGRRTLGREAARNVRGVRRKCPDDFDALARRVEAAAPQRRVCYPAAGGVCLQGAPDERDDLPQPALQQVAPNPRAAQGAGDRTRGRRISEDPALGGDALFAAMAAHPILIKRPIVVAGARAALGRPPEAALAIL